MEMAAPVAMAVVATVVVATAVVATVVAATTVMVGLQAAGAHWETPVAHGEPLRGASAEVACPVVAVRAQ